MSQRTLPKSDAMCWVRRPGLFSLCAALAGFYGAHSVQAQTFNSGSTGADGALSFTTPGTYNFDPKALRIDPEGDNVFHFTTVTIASGVTLKITSKVLNGPVYWLASGNVTISGVIDISGDDGHTYTIQTSVRVPSAPGSGGYSGGVGGSIVSGQPAAQPGNGPGGGAIAPIAENSRGGSGTYTGNQFLTPLVGGSGGGGAKYNTGNNLGGGGGAGGGAILIASSGTITINNGTINADGGIGGGGTCASVCGGPGAGGAIRLVANTVNGGGATVVARTSRGLLNPQNSTPFGFGAVRIETYNASYNYNFNSTPLYIGTPLSIILPATPPPALIVTAINGTPVNSNPFTFPDTTINTGSPVTISILAQYVPVGTVPKVHIFSEAGADQVINASALAGTLASSTATAQITFPSGGSRGFVKATW